MKIVVLDDYQNIARTLADWDSLDAEVEVINSFIGDQDELVRRLAGAQVVVAMRERTRFTAELLDRLADLKLLVSTGRRNAAIDLKATDRLGITVCGTGYLPSPTAEHTWALILAAQRNLETELAAMREGAWQTTVGLGLHGKTLALLGLGNLGQRVARIGQAFGMDTIAWSQNLTAERAAEHGVTAVTKEELFARADVLSVHLVLSKRTRGLVGAADLAAMKPGALLVNTSRGPIVDEQALVDAVREQRIRAALDVYDEEPLPADHPLRALSGATLTPHLGYVTREVYEIFYRDAVDDIAAWRDGNPVRVMTLR